MSLETKISDNLIAEKSFSTEIQDSDSTPFLKKNLTFITDSQNGSGTYTSGQLTWDGSSLAAVGGNSVQDWSNAYIVLPYNLKCTITGGTGYAPSGGNTRGVNYLCAMKNNSLIDSITVEHMGRTIINQTTNLSHLVNFKMHATTSQDALNKVGASIFYYPDSVGAATSTASIAGTRNVDNNPTPLITATATSSLNSAEFYNAGLLRRQQMLFGNAQTNFNTATYLKQEADVYQSVSAFPTTTTSAVNCYDLHFNAIIYLKDLSDYFAKHPISRGAGYKIYVRVNQAVSTIVHTTSTTPFAQTATNTITSLTSGTVQPGLLCCGPNTLCANYTLGTTDTNTLILTSAIDTTSDARPNGLRLYVPGYECAPETLQQIIKQPVIRRPFIDIYSNLIQNQATQAYINQQIAGAISKPRAIVIMPQFSQTTQTQTSQASCFNPCPGVTDPQLSLTQIQIKVGSTYVLPDRLNYNFNAFLENTAQMFGLNGNQTREMSSGIIDAQKFRNNYRYYAFDLSRYPEAVGATPQLISLEAFNNSSVNVDLYIFVLYERDCEIDIASGGVQVA